jgi:hypothetical protein
MNTNTVLRIEERPLYLDNWEYDELLRTDDCILVINGFTSLIDVNADCLNLEGYDKAPLYATVHSGVFFKPYNNKPYMGFDTGEVGYILTRNEPSEESINSLINTATTIYNGWEKEICVVSYNICPCCGDEDEGEVLEGLACFNYQDEEEAIQYLKDNYNITEEE